MAVAESTDDELVARLREVAARLNRRDEDLVLRRDLYRALYTRGYSMPAIAEIASVGRDKPLGYKSVSFIINEGAKAWPKNKPQAKRPARRTRRAAS